MSQTESSYCLQKLSCETCLSRKLIDIEFRLQTHASREDLLSTQSRDIITTVYHSISIRCHLLQTPSVDRQNRGDNDKLINIDFIKMLEMLENVKLSMEDLNCTAQPVWMTSTIFNFIFFQLACAESCRRKFPIIPPGSHTDSATLQKHPAEQMRCY